MRIETAIFLSLLFVLLICPRASAQEPMHMHDMGERHPAWFPKELQLNPAQMEQMKRIQRRYLGEIKSLRNRLLNKRYNLRRLLADPTAKSSEIRTRQKEVSALENEIQEKLLDYQLEMREILTPKQFRVWISKNQAMFGRGMHHKRGMGMMHR